MQLQKVEHLQESFDTNPETLAQRKLKVSKFRGRFAHLVASESENFGEFTILYFKQISVMKKK